MAGSSSSNRCAIILSAKSSGSSMLQRLLATDGRVRLAPNTRHGENETLYWTKAASVLGLPQTQMLDSEVPIPSARAAGELIEFIAANLGERLLQAPIDKESIFQAWRRLCMEFTPIFLEKSPHHLLQWSALELIAECMDRFDDLDFVIIGLVRNPMDTIYSAWKRWQIYPELKQHEWLQEYENLLRSRALFGDRLTIVRYEDLVSGEADLSPLCAALGIERLELDRQELHASSIQKWRNDSSYGFALTQNVVGLAERFGYPESSLHNPNHNPMWLPYRNLVRIQGRATRLMLETARRALGRLA